MSGRRAHPGPYSPVAAAIYRLLGNGEPIPLEELLYEVGQVIPPSKAFHDAIRLRENARKSHASPNPTGPRPIEDDQTIRAGRRSMVTSTLNGIRNRGFYTTEIVDGVETVMPTRKAVLWKELFYNDDPA